MTTVSGWLKEGKYAALKCLANGDSDSFRKSVTNKSPEVISAFRFRLIRFTTPSYYNVDRFAAELNALRECKLVFFFNLFSLLFP